MRRPPSPPSPSLPLGGARGWQGCCAPLAAGPGPPRGVGQVAGGWQLPLQAGSDSASWDASLEGPALGLRVSWPPFGAGGMCWGPGRAQCRGEEAAQGGSAVGPAGRPQGLPELGVLPRAGLPLQAGTSPEPPSSPAAHGHGGRPEPASSPAAHGHGGRLEPLSSPAAHGYGGHPEQLPSVSSRQLLPKRPPTLAG